uniref:Ataxin-3 n=1 Tax=Macrostomum lignano TaxID=282301 RepID=A0A1I8FBU8_9PLAT
MDRAGGVIDLLNDGPAWASASWAARAPAWWSAPHPSSGGAADRDGRLCSGDHIPPQRRHGVAPAAWPASTSPASCGQCSDQVPPYLPAPRRPGRGVAQPDGGAGRLCQLTPTAELDAHLADLLATMQPQLNDEEAMAEAEQQDSREQFHKPPQLPNSRNSAEENPEEDFENEEEKHFTVNGSSLEGCSNHAAVELLRSCGSRVRLRLVRYKSGHVHHQLMAHT